MGRRPLLAVALGRGALWVGGRETLKGCLCAILLAVAVFLCHSMYSGHAAFCPFRYGGVCVFCVCVLCLCVCVCVLLMCVCAKQSIAHAELLSKHVRHERPYERDTSSFDQSAQPSSRTL